MRLIKAHILSLTLVVFASSLHAQQWQYSNSNAHFVGGNVGIGTDAPASKLHIIGNIAIENATATAPTMQLQNTGFSNFGSLISYPGTGTNTGSSFSVVPRGTGYSSGIRSQIGVLNTDMTVDPVNYEFLVARATGDQFCVASGKSGTGTVRPLLLSAGYGDGATNPTQLFLNTDGNVGIGTVSPSQKLDVQGTVKATSLLTGNITYVLNDNFTYDGRSFGHYALGWGADTWDNTLQNASPAAWFSAYGGIKFFTSGQVKMAIDGNGNVGIGTTHPGTYRLAVEGTVGARKVKVTQAPWADYVFHPTYRLRPLSEVEEYIQKYHHLPEVPTAAEVDKEGLDLGDNQATLLKKIEELTLYLIEQNKRLEAQIKKNEEQNKRLDQQQQQINELKKLIKE